MYKIIYNIRGITGEFDTNDEKVVKRETEYLKDNGNKFKVFKVDSDDESIWYDRTKQYAE